MEDLKNKLKEFMSVSLITDPLSGKTEYVLKEGEELDVGQIKEFTKDEIKELGFNYHNICPLTYFDGEDFKTSRSVTKFFDSIEKLKDFIAESEHRINCSWIRHHTINDRCVISYFPDVSPHDEVLSDTMITIRMEINNLIRQHIPKGKTYPSKLDVSEITKQILNDIKEYPYEDKKPCSGDRGIAELLEFYEKTGLIK